MDITCKCNEDGWYICDEMIKIDPENAEIYKANADEYIGKIQNIDTQIRKIVNKMDKKKLYLQTNFHYYILQKNMD